MVLPPTAPDSLPNKVVTSAVFLQSRQRHQPLYEQHLIKRCFQFADTAKSSCTQKVADVAKKCIYVSSVRVRHIVSLWLWSKHATEIRLCMVQDEHV